MYKKCPKCGHERAPGETGPEDVCGACGLIYSKYLKSRLAPAVPEPAADAVDVLGDLGLLNRAQAVGRLMHLFGVLVLIASFVWGAATVWRQYRVRT